MMQIKSLGKPLSGVTNILYGVSIQDYIVPADLIVALCPMHGLPDRQILLINNQQLAYHPNNESYILSHCNNGTIPEVVQQKLLEGYELSQEIEKKRFDYMK